MILKWELMYSVNVKEIDDQHKKIFDIINKLFDSQKKEKINYSEIIKELEDYSAYHFKTEEFYFDKFNYDRKEEHKLMHQAYIGKINEFKKNMPDGESLKNFLKSWWLNHIQGADQKYSDFFNSNGLI